MVDAELEIVKELLCRYGSLYAPQLVVLAALSAITVFRREMSCNRCYNADDDDDDDDDDPAEDKGESKEGEAGDHAGGGGGRNGNNNSTTAATAAAALLESILGGSSSSSASKEWDAAETEQLLEGAGLYCSGAALLPLWVALLEHAERARQGFHDAEDRLLQGAEAYFGDAARPLLLTTPDDYGDNDWDADGGGDAKADRLACEKPPQKLFDINNYNSVPAAAQDDVDESTSSSSSSGPGLSAASASVDTQEPESEPQLPPQHFLTSEFPADAQVHVLSFLHPRDVVSLGCASRAGRDLVSGGGGTSNSRNINTTAASETATTTSVAVWKTLWHRDYAWIVKSWAVGRQALERTGVNLDDFPYSKDFYFNFGLSYLNYVLAGHATPDSCLVGIGGHVYDLSPFVLTHPGSPETVLVQAGKDATRFFQSVRHTLGARRIAQSLCVVVDASRLPPQPQQPPEDDNNNGNNNNNSPSSPPPSHGLFPTAQTELALTGIPNNDNVAIRVPHALSSPPISTNLVPDVLPTDTLRRMRDGYRRGEGLAGQRAAALLAGAAAGTLSAVGDDCHVYHDPFAGEWRAWYLDSNTQEAVFVRLPPA